MADSYTGKYHFTVSTFLTRCSVKGGDAVVFKAISPYSRQNLKHMLSCMKLKVETKLTKRRTGPSDRVRLHTRHADRHPADYVKVQRHEHLSSRVFEDNICSHEGKEVRESTLSSYYSCQLPPSQAPCPAECGTRPQNVRQQSAHTV